METRLRALPSAGPAQITGQLWRSVWVPTCRSGANQPVSVARSATSQLFNPDSVPQVLAQEDDGSNARDHEGCYIGPIFDHSASLSELDFGSVVNCTSGGILYIRMDAYLYKLDNDDEWVHISTARNLAGNPDSPQAVVFLTSITDVMMGS